MGWTLLRRARHPQVGLRDACLQVLLMCRLLRHLLSVCRSWQRMSCSSFSTTRRPSNVTMQDEAFVRQSLTVV